MPWSEAVVAAPIRKLWPANFLESNPAACSASLSSATKRARVRGL